MPQALREDFIILAFHYVPKHLSFHLLISQVLSLREFSFSNQVIPEVNFYFIKRMKQSMYGLLYPNVVNRLHFLVASKKMPNMC